MIDERNVQRLFCPVVGLYGIVIVINGKRDDGKKILMCSCKDDEIKITECLYNDVPMDKLYIL